MASYRKNTHLKFKKNQLGQFSSNLTEMFLELPSKIYESLAMPILHNALHSILCKKYLDQDHP